jgi:hypothetical protein
MGKVAAAAVVLALATLPVAAAAARKAPPPYRLAPYKDELFQYQNILDSQYDGDYLLVEYSRPRDLYGRDAEVGTRVDPRYVSLDTDAVQSELELQVGAATLKYVGVGMTAGKARAIVIFLHGLGTGRSSGVNDWIHGGNFNRIKNLMMRNEGVYVSPSFSDFAKKGTAEIKALILYEAGLSPNAPVFLACGSAGGDLCWRLLADSEVAPLLGGILFLDASMNERYAKTAATLDPSERVPIQISSSREDQILGWRTQLKFFKNMKEAVPDYPIRLVVFTAGTHGISLRMTDWRLTLNWMLEVGDKAKLMSKKKTGD